MQINKIPAKRRYRYKISRNDLKLGSYHLAESIDLGTVKIDNLDEFHQPTIDLLSKMYSDRKEINLNV